MSTYNPQEFEQSIVAAWEKEGVYKTPKLTDTAKKSYCLSMFPYPSGSGLHVGHVRIYTGTDVLARYFRMKGNQILHPMGWDAFGLPAENAAIKAKKNPLDMVPGNIANFKRQMQSLGLSYDWEREVSTTDPSYYKWTQWLFIQFFKKGLLYKKNTPINFCPKCKTGLAEEEVLANGTHERCGSTITKKELPQWIFKITDYAERLLEDLKLLDWPKGILEMQKNWIGKKSGINITYSIEGTKEVLTCFTTRPDTNFGATFIVIAPEHSLIQKIIDGKIKVEGKRVQELKEYREKTAAKSEMERESEGKRKTGTFTGLYAINNLNGKKLPIWTSDFVLVGFGTGAVVGVPGHDLRDFDFAQTFKIDVLRVVKGKNGDTSPIVNREQVQEEEGVMINSEFLDGMDIHTATAKIMDYLEEKKWGKRITTYHLRDWIFSRQRYWGEPIPMVHCEKCGWNPIPESELPLVLPYTKSYEPTETGESPLSAIPEFVNTTCPVCHGKAVRETDTMPNWAGSCWYFIRFAQEKRNETLPEFTEGLKKLPWMPVDWYLGGAEHAVLHLLYARFWVKALQDMGLLTFSEPFLRLRNVGMVLAEDHRKMSKSWGNTINPDDVISQFGADTLRLYEMFMAPFNMEIAWSTTALQGAYRFVKRVWKLFDGQVSDWKTKSDPELLVKLNKTIQKVGDDIEQTKFNTAVAAMMEFLNLWEAKPNGLSLEDAKKFIQILSPFAPFVSDKIWRDVCKEKTSIHTSVWPIVDERAFQDAIITIPVQINGKVRAMIQIPSKMSEEASVVEVAKKNERVIQYLEGKQYKVIYVKGRILNFVM